jgi:hypothetical protein
MTAMKTSKGMLSVRILGAVLAALFAMFAAGCTDAGTGAGTGPAPNAPNAPAPHGAPAPGVVVVAPTQTNV